MLVFKRFLFKPMLGKFQAQAINKTIVNVITQGGYGHQTVVLKFFAVVIIGFIRSKNFQIGLLAFFHFNFFSFHFIDLGFFSPTPYGRFVLDFISLIIRYYTDKDALFYISMYLDLVVIAHGIQAYLFGFIVFEQAVVKQLIFYPFAILAGIDKNFHIPVFLAEYIKIIIIISADNIYFVCQHIIIPFCKFNHLITPAFKGFHQFFSI